MSIEVSFSLGNYVLGFFDFSKSEFARLVKKAEQTRMGLSAMLYDHGADLGLDFWDEQRLQDGLEVHQAWRDDKEIVVKDKSGRHTFPAESCLSTNERVKEIGDPDNPSGDFLIVLGGYEEGGWTYIFNTESRFVPERLEVRTVSFWDMVDAGRYTVHVVDSVYYEGMSPADVHVESKGLQYRFKPTILKASRGREGF